MNKSKPIPIDRVKQLLEYREGVLYWKNKSAQKTTSGSAAGTKRTDGYIQLMIDGVWYRAHRIIWSMHNDCSHPLNIDHINGIKHDNRIENLRVVDEFGNSQNIRSARKDNKIGFLGVYFDKQRNKFRAEIVVKGKKIQLGRFEDPKEAHEAYLEAKRKYHLTCTI